MGISKIAAIATAGLSGFDSTMEKLGKFRDRIVGWGSAIRKAYTGSNTPIQTRGADPFVKANEDRLHKLEQVRKGVSSVTGTVKAGILGFAALGAMFGADKIVGSLFDITQAMFDVDRQARHMGERTDTMMGFQYAIKRTGEDIQEATQALGNLYDNFLDAGNGSIIASRKFTELGLSVKNMMHGSDFKFTQLEVMDETIRKLAFINNHTERMAKARTLFGSNTLAMLPIIEKHRQGSDIEKQIGKQIGMGAAISGNEVALLRETAFKFEDAALIFKSAWIQIAIAMAPFAKMIADWVASLTEGKDLFKGAGVGLSAWILNAFEKVHNWFIDFVVSITRAFGWFSNGFLIGFTSVAKSLMDAINASGVGVIDTKGINKDLSKMYEDKSNRDEMEKRWEAKKYKPLIEGKSSLEGNYEYMLGKITKGVGLGNWINPARDQQKMLAQNEPLFAAADSLLPSLLTPFEKYTESIDKLARIQEIGAFGDSSGTRYGQALNQQLLSLENTLGLMNVQLPTVSRQNTAQAESSVSKSRLEYDLKTVDTPQKRLERIQTQGNEIQMRIETAVKDLAKAQGQRRPLVLKP